MANAQKLAAFRNVAPLRPVRSAVCKETIEVLETLLDCAREGSVVGVAVVAALGAPERGGFYSNLTGYCVKNPTAARGMVAYLADQVAGAQHRQQE